MSSNFWLTEEQFNKIRPLPPNKSRGVPRVDDRRVLSGIISCIQRSYRWSDVPPEYGPAKTLYNRWKRWSEAGVFEHVFAALVREMADLSTLMIPSRDSGHQPRQNTSHRGARCKKHRPWAQHWQNKRRAEFEATSGSRWFWMPGSSGTDGGQSRRHFSSKAMS